MIRLQRVTFLALHDYLGLTTELTRADDNSSQVQTTHRTHNHHHHRRRSHTHTNIVQHIPATSTDTLDTREDDNELFQPTSLTSSVSYTSPSADQTQVTATPDVTNSINEQENVVTPLSSEAPAAVSVSAQKRVANFAGQRSYSVVESRNTKPDFEEAAARARVKNSLDTTFFEKHKISYPNVSNRLSNAGPTKRRSSFSDVKLHFSLSFLTFFY